MLIPDKNNASPTGQVTAVKRYPGPGVFVEVSAIESTAAVAAAASEEGEFAGYIVVENGVLFIYSQAPVGGVYPDGTWRISVIGGEHAKDKMVTGSWTEHTRDDV